MPPRAEGRPARRRRRPAVESLDGRILPSLGVQYALGVGVTGRYVDIRANAVATDAAGDAYVTGSLVGSANFAAGQGAATTLANAGSRDLYVAKYSPAGVLLWAEDMPGANGSSVGQGGGIAVDPSGNVLLTGSYSGTITLGPGSGATALTSGASAFDGFVAKLDGSGRVLWARDIGASAYAVDAGQAITADASGNVYATGLFSGTATFGATALTTASQDDAFVTKLGPNGNFLWAVATQGSSYPAATQGNGIAVDASGNVGVAGSFSAQVDFNPGAGVANLTSAGSKDAFLWKLNPDGSFAWAEGFGGGDVDQANAVAVDAAGDFVTTGGFTGRVAFGATTLTAGGSEDAFVLKAGPTGAVLWARSFAGTAGPSVGRAVTLDGAGDVLTDGDFSGTVDFNPGAGSAPLTSAGSTNVYLSELDSAGNYLAVQGMSAPGANFGFGVAASASGAASIVGTYTGPATLGGATIPQAGNASLFVAGLGLGAAPPAAPGAPVLEAASDTGVSQADDITASTSPVFDVPGAVAADTVLLLRDGSVVATRTGPGAIADPGPVPAGYHTYTAIQRDAQGNASSPGPSLGVTFLTIPPPAPAAPALLAADDSGTPGDGLTSARRPRLAGLAQANSTVQLLDASGAVLGTTTSGGDGSYTVAPAADLADGPHTLSVRAIDAAGNVGAPGAALLLTIDATPPAAPTGLALFAADDSGVIGDGITNVRQPRLVGAAEAGSTVQLLDPAGVVLATAAAGPDGSFTVRPAGALADGTYAYRVRAVDAAGNVGPTGPALSLTIDATPPPAPGMPALLAADDSGALGDGITNVRLPRLTGTVAPGSTVLLLDSAGLVLGSTTAGPAGAYTVTPAAGLAEGAHPVRVEAVDAAGNVGAPSVAFPLTIDATPPAAPAGLALLAADDSGAIGDGITNVTSPRLTGKAEPAATVQLLDATGTVLATTTAGADGSFTVRAPQVPADGTYAYQVRAIDAAGNVGPAGPTLTLTIDATPPPAPGTPTLLAADDSGLVGDGITNVRRPRLAGLGAPGSLIQLLDAGGGVLGAATAGPDGSFTVAPAADLADGPHSLRVEAVDMAGNLSTPSAAVLVTIESLAPAAPPAPSLLAADDTGATGDGITSVRRPRLVGRAAPGATVQLLDSGGVVLATATSGADGSYTVATTADLTDGMHSLSVRALDVAGNLGPIGPSFLLTIDTAAPAAPAAPKLLAADDSGTMGDGLTDVNQPRLVGVTEPNAFILLTGAGGAFLGWTQAGPDGSYTVQPGAPLAVGSYPLSVHAIDAAGNVGATGPALSLTILAAAPPAPAAPTLLAADDSGTVGDGLTDVNQPRLIGVTEPNAFILLTGAGGAFLAWTQAGPDGSYAIKPAAPLGDGSYLLSVHAIDAAGNVGATGPALRLSILTTTPPTPAAPVILAADDSGLAGDGITDRNQPRLVGVAEPNAFILLTGAGGAFVGWTQAGAAGSYTVQPAAPLADGVYQLGVHAVDAAGNVGATGPALRLTVLTTPPPAPVAPALLAADDSGTRGDGITNVRRPRLIGRATPGAVVELLNAAGAVLARTTAAADGSYTATPGAALADGRYAIRARATDAAGNVGALGPAWTLTILATPPAKPAAPALLPADMVGSVRQSNSTTLRQPHLTGAAPAGQVVQVLNSAGAVVATGRSGSNGRYTIQFPHALALGVQSWRVRIQDVAGNLSAASAAFALTIRAR